MRETGLGRIARTLRNPSYGPYVAGNSLSLIGLWVQRVAVGWLTWELTGSAAWLGIVSLADLAPALLVGPFAGAYADRADRLRIVRIAQTLAMVQALALAALTAASLMRIELLVALVLANGIVVGINQPARLSLVSSLVPRADLPTAVAINSIVFNLARFVGPALAGVLIVQYGPAAAFAFNALSFVFFLVVLARISIEPETASSRASADASLARSVVEGVRYVAGHPGIGPLLALMVGLSLGVRSFVELLPGYADRVFGGGAGTLAALASALGLGAVGGGAWLAWRGERPGLVRLTLVAVAFCALAAAAFAMTSGVLAGLACALGAGVALTMAGVGAQIRIQTAVDPALRARVLSLYGLAMRGGPALGALAMGFAADRVGLRWPLLVGAAAVSLLWLPVWARRARIARSLERP